MRANSSCSHDSQVELTDGQARPVLHFNGCDANRANHPCGSSACRMLWPTPWRLSRPRRTLVPRRVHAVCTSTWLPIGANTELAHGVGDAHSVTSQSASAVSIQAVGSKPVRNSGSPRPPFLTEAALHVEALCGLQHVVAGAGELVRQRLGGDDRIGACALALMKAFCFRTPAPSHVCRLNERPG